MQTLEMEDNDENFTMPHAHMSAGALQMHAASSATRERIEGELAEEVPMEIWQNEPMQECDFTNEQETDSDNSDPNWCFVCFVKENESDAHQSKNYNNLINFIEENKSKIGPRQLVNQTQYFYNRWLRPRVNGQKPWTRKMIWEHIDKHSPSNTTILLDIRRTYHEGMLRLRDNGLFTKEATSGKKGINYNAFNMYIRLEKQINSVMTKLKDNS